MSTIDIPMGGVEIFQKLAWAHWGMSLPERLGFMMCKTMNGF